MTEEVKQAVVEGEAAATPAVEQQESAREDVSLEHLLEQYDQGVKAQPTPEQVPVEPVDNTRLRAIELRLFQEDVNKTLSNVLEEISVPDTPETRLLAMGFVDQMAVKEPKIRQAFDNRLTNPGAWKKFERSLGSEFKRYISSFTIDSQATQDREAVAAAVRGASTKVAPAPPAKLGGMSNSEYRKHVRENYGFDPGV